MGPGRSRRLLKDNGGASVAASIGVEVVFFHTEASVAMGAHLISTGDVVVHAENAIGIQNMALSGAASAGGAGVGGAIVVNVFPDITTEAFIDSNMSTHITQVDAAGKVEVSAKSSIKEADPIKVPIIGDLPKFSSVALAAAASSGGAAVSGSVIVDVFLITTSAQINSGTKINQFTGAGGSGSQTLKVEATDDTSLTNIAGGLNFSSDSAGVGIGIDVDVIEKHVSAVIQDNTVITTGGTIDVKAASTENFHELAVDVGGSSSGAAVDGSVIVVVLDPSSTVAERHRHGARGRHVRDQRLRQRLRLPARRRRGGQHLVGRRCRLGDRDRPPGHRRRRRRLELRPAGEGATV